ncbi:hypothetical protein ABPG72_001547 [Tetrahymena utriculariae]
MQNQANIVDEIQKSYQNQIDEPYLFCLRRQKVRDQDKRVIYLGVPDNQVCDNRIQTSKYNYITFIPQNLLLQFSKLANIYFLIIGIFQILPSITTTEGKPIVYTPLTVIVVISMIKDFIEDRKRRKQDQFENQSDTSRLNIKTGQFEKVKWQELRIGEIIQVNLNERFPADILVLSTTNQYGISYIETKNLDGEVNLKQRQSCAPNLFEDEQFIQNSNNLARFQFIYEDPNIRIHSFNGIMIDKQDADSQQNQYLLSLQNICLRGCTLKRTHSLIGIVIYSGHDCKSLKYANRGQYKFGTVEKLMNKMVLYVFVILVLISIFCASYYTIWYKQKKDELPYLVINKNDIESHLVVSFFIRIPMWILLLNPFVPISLMVTLEIVKYLQGQLLSKDKNFVNSLSDELVEVNSSNLTDQLGQVKYILTDKTGTLTANIMKFKALSLNSVCYEYNYEQDKHGILMSQKLIDLLKNAEENQIEYEALMCMNLCHELLIEQQEGKRLYLGTSPDEECIMDFCIQIGIYLESVDEHKVMTIYDSINNTRLQFKLIALHEYRSDIRKMSVLVQNLSTKQYKIYQKGSMNTIFDCCRQDQKNNMVLVEEHLNNFASNMLRTLCLSYRNLNENEITKFFDKRSKDLEGGNLNIQEINDGIFAEIENEQILIGGTGVNDEFADQVVPTLSSLKQAGLKIWMITGDKRETALSIGIKSNIVEQGIELKVIQDATDSVINDQLVINELKMYEEQLRQQQKLSIGLSGLTFHGINMSKNTEIKQSFNYIMKHADSVLAYHFTPSQKKLLVDLVHTISPGQCVLAIGDGANDINMLQAADVGIGIRGKEGREAAKASDFSIAEFKHLNRLILYVGQEAYRKNSYLILFNFYKNQAWILVYFWINFYSGQSAQYVYDQWISQFFNLFYSSLPIIIYALFDEIHPSSQFFKVVQTDKNILESRPQDYKKFTNNLIFQQKNFWKWFFYGSFHALIITYISFFSVGDNSDQQGRQSDIFCQGMLAFTCCVIITNLKVQQLHQTHCFLNLFFIYASIAFYLLNIFIASKIIKMEIYEVYPHLFCQPNTYFAIALSIVVAYGADSAYKIFIQTIIPEKTLILQPLKSKQSIRFSQEEKVVCQDIDIDDIIKNQQENCYSSGLHEKLITKQQQKQLKDLRINNQSSTSIYKDLEEPYENDIGYQNLQQNQSLYVSSSIRHSNFPSIRLQRVDTI